MNQTAKHLLYAGVAICFFAAAACTQAQSPGIGSPYAIDQAGLSMWGSAPSPHLVIRAPVDNAGGHVQSATIPRAVTLPVWKQPYAYGYFGATARRHPYQSFGHQQAFHEWRWR